MKGYQHILKAFVKLGSFIDEFCENVNDSNAEKFVVFHKTIRIAEQQNGWFTKENIMYCLQEWATLLTEANLTNWLTKYNLEQNRPSKTIGIVMAGNIPLVGFHDFLCVLFSGNKVLVKLSSNDKVLLPFLTDFLLQQEPSLKEKIHFTDGKFEGFDAIIATGSNNTSRYFEYYFGKKPNIIRKNRSSVAILSGNETKAQLALLGEDIFRYYGLGCRNVSKVYVPKDYDLSTLYEAIFNFKDIINQHKYANNYDYNKAVYLMSDFKILDNGFLILKEDDGFSSPISVLFYSYYESESELRGSLEKHSDTIQCIVASGESEGDIAFGQTQKPQLHDYADAVDTMEFLLQL
ncbi:MULTISPECIES: acyl-CoA reductase [Flavobacteriaceae]|uniref:acyl-CoA reductase n=1 Tax=Flavobacteriaceae TaxID=49546 RepID=UPI0014930730|nr:MULTISPECIES: acyl-CoA reductase [Allomuricauda]MDC6364583.1 acyl-CoA reductase [Muricauda sp. AC10]